MIDLQIEGFLSPAEGERLFELTKGLNVLEIGSYKGRSTWFMAIGAKFVLCIDPMKMEFDPETLRIEMGNTYTTIKAFTENILNRFKNVQLLLGTTKQKITDVPDHYFDVIFIDGWHTYEDCESDVLLTWEKLKEGGRMIFHDMGNFEGVGQVLFDYFPDMETAEGTLAVVQKRTDRPLQKGIQHGE